MRLFVSVDHKSGFAIKEDGDIVSVFSAGPDALPAGPYRSSK